MQKWARKFAKRVENEIERENKKDRGKLGGRSRSFTEATEGGFIPMTGYFKLDAIS